MDFSEIDRTKPASWESLPTVKLAEQLRQRYQDLVSALSASGSVVRRRTMSQRPKTTECGEWATGSAAIEVIFPKQESMPLTTDASYIISGEEITAERVDEAYEFDPRQVAGHIYIYLDTDHNRIHEPRLQVTDLRSPSELPEEACEAIQAAFRE